MAISITLYNTASEPNAIRKNLSVGTTFSGNVRGSGEIEVVNPVVEIEAQHYNANYAYIPDFGRYYYITETQYTRTGLMILTLRSDPLMSFQADILALPAIAWRVSGSNGALFNSYLPDDKMRLSAAEISGTWVIATFAYGNQYLLVTAG